MRDAARCVLLTHWISGGAICLVASLLADAGSTPAKSQNRTSQISCIPLPRDTATPPPTTPPPPKAMSDGSTSVVQPPSMQPVCPEGQIPVITQSPPALLQQNPGTGTRPLKGNPLLRPQSAVAPPLNQPGAAGLAHEFSEIYGPGAAAPPKKAPAPAPSKCLGKTYGTDPTCYYYGSAGVSRNVIGGGMMISVDRPHYVGTGGPGHTLNEISMQGGVQSGNIVEIGWTVSTEQNGDADPHIFVFHWVNWDGKGYNCCGWVQFSSRYYPGQNVSPLIGRETYIGYVFYNGNWWAWFDGDWIGYFPEQLWQNNFSTAALMQWFGEVATNNGVPPLTQMGDGILPPPPNAAHMSKLCDVDASTWTCMIRNEQQLATPDAPKYYGIVQTGYGDTRYGGPGK